MEVPRGRERKGLFARGRRTELHQRHAVGHDPAGEAGVGGLSLRPWSTRLVGVWRPGDTPCLLPAQQQDDLGAAFQTWMDASGALKAEVPPGALPTWGPFLGETEMMAHVWSVPSTWPALSDSRPEQGPETGLSLFSFLQSPFLLSQEEMLSWVQSPQQLPWFSPTTHQEQEARCQSTGSVKTLAGDQVSPRI